MSLPAKTSSIERTGRERSRLDYYRRPMKPHREVIMQQPTPTVRTLAQERAAERRWWWALSMYLVVGLLAAVRYSGPAPQGRDADGPSAVRAIETLDMLLGEGEPVHAAGSPENEHVRVRLLGALSDLKAETWVWPLANANGLRGGMANIIARVPGEPRARPLILITHYDACPQGPGAGDAGQCVAAILELLRVLQEQPLRYELWCVFTDGEERGIEEKRGLRGSSDLVARTDFPWGDERPFVINFDARGDRGAVLLYETHGDNLKAMQIAASGLAAPRVSTSLMVNIYRRLPNGSDFTMFRNAGWQGWNFAVIAGADRYHTAEDNIANLSPRSIQHFASHAHSLTRRLDQLSEEELRSLEDSEPAVFFDLLGQFIVVYPASWNWGHLAVVSILALAGWYSARRRIRTSRCLLAIGLIAVAVVASGVVGWAITRGLQAADMLPRRFVRHSEWICLLYLVAALFVFAMLGRRLSARCTRSELLTAVVLALIALAAGSSAYVPGGAYLFLWPATAVALLLLVDAWWDLPGWMSQNLGALACIVPALLYAPTYVLLAQAMGPTAGATLTVAVALMLLPTLLPWADPATPAEHGT